MLGVQKVKLGVKALVIIGWICTYFKCKKLDHYAHIPLYILLGTPKKHSSISTWNYLRLLRSRMLNKITRNLFYCLIMFNGLQLILNEKNLLLESISIFNSKGLVERASIVDSKCSS